MGRLFLATLAMATGLACAAAPGPLPGPGPRDTCPVCGMLVAKYPNWIAQVHYRNGHAHYFDGAKDMFKYLQALPKYAPGHRAADIQAIQVTEFYGLTRIDARKAWYVIGSDVYGPMGHELVPLASRADAEEFQRDHKGRRILTYDQVSPAVVAAVDDGRF
ncbi:MAG: nitrous oxide reductase accessory protein NosL [Gallionellaceae bacterium]|nr:nitrous oxide reductase accessory protein NosL [Gallionellaceae bacterium]